MRSTVPCVLLLFTAIQLGSALPKARGAGQGADVSPGITTACLNDLTIGLDSDTGAIRTLAYPGPGTLLDADAAEAGLVDVAYPLDAFEPLRLAARFGHGAVIQKSADQVVVRVKLDPSRPQFPVDGEVVATVVLRAENDKRSIALTCDIENRSRRALRQVVFPELRGLLAVAGPEQTILKSCGSGSAPFRELAVGESDQWYAVNNSTVELKSGGMFSTMWGRWLDLGGLQGGFSLFPQRWGWEPRTSTVVQLRQTTRRLRLLCVNPAEVPPGGHWTSGTWLFTPHRYGWAKGIEPYRQWVHSKLHRRYSMPANVREGLGFRTLWMCQNQPNDPADTVWRFCDLPAMAREAKDHGLREMVLWSWEAGFDAALPAPYRHLGTEGELLKAVAACRKLGVNVAPFISVLAAGPKSAARYGLTIPDNNGWTYHTEMIPRWNPPYASGYSCVQVGPSNPKWQDEVAASCRRWADKGLISLSWDQYLTTTDKPNIQDLTRRIRDYARSKDPQSTFSGEEISNVEIDGEWLDYTWDWQNYRDCQGFVNAFGSPRPNVNINRSAAEARFAFMDNLFLNVWPAKPDGINGSERIVNVPELSRTLKTCAALRQQFLRYFTEGALIGNCLLTAPSPGVRLAGYVLPDRALAIVLNEGSEGELTFGYDLGGWLGGDKFTCTRYDESGRETLVRNVPASGTLPTGRLKRLEMTVFEFRPKKGIQ